MTQDGRSSDRGEPGGAIAVPEGSGEQDLEGPFVEILDEGYPGESIEVLDPPRDPTKLQCPYCPRSFRPALDGRRDRALTTHLERAHGVETVDAEAARDPLGLRRLWRELRGRP